VTEAVARGIPVRAATRKTTRITWTVHGPSGSVRTNWDAGRHKAALARYRPFSRRPPLDADRPAKLNPFIDKAGQMGVRHICSF